MLSIIIPNYNHSRYLDERIESILNQTYTDWELIILDDCSNDNSKEIIRKYESNPKIAHVVFNVINSGSTFKQWAKGISLAKGNYIWIAESDDVAHPEFVMTLMNRLIENDDTSIAFADSFLINQESEILDLDLDKLYDYNQKNQEFSKYDTNQFVQDKMILQNRMYNASSIIFKKTLWDGIDKSFISLKLCGDWICWLSMLKQSRYIIQINKKLNYFRQHSNKVTPKNVSDGNAFKERKNVIDFLINNYQNISSLRINAAKGKNIHMISTSNLDKSTKQEIYYYLKIPFLSRQIYKVIYFIYNGINKYFR